MYASVRIIVMITDDMGLVCGMYGEKRNAYGILVRKHEGKRPLGRRRVDASIILKLVFGKWGGIVWAGLIWFRTGTGCGFCRLKERFKRKFDLILVNDQLDALFLNVFISCSTCFEHKCSSSGGPNCIHTSSGITHSGG
jgi:hypothetical protein